MSRRSRGRPRLVFAILVAVAIPATLLIATLVRTGSRPATTSTRLIPVGGRPSAVVVARGLVWVADDERHVVHAIDPRTGSAVTSIAVARNPVALAASGRWLWVGHATGVVVRVDMEKRRAGPRLAAGQSITGIAARGNRVWACDLPNNALVEIDAKKAKVVRSIHVSRGPVRVIATARTLWVTNKENTVTPVDEETGKPRSPVRVGAGPIGLVQAAHSVWVVSSDDGTLTRIAETSRHVIRKTEMGNGPVDVAFANNHIWVVLQDDRAVAKVNVLTGLRIGQPIPLGTRPRGVAGTPTDLYVVGTDPGALIRVLA